MFYIFNREKTAPQSEKGVIDNISILKILFGPDCKTGGKSTLPVRIATNKTIVVDMLNIKDDWQDDHRWIETSGAKEKKYKVSFDDGNVIANRSDSLQSQAP